MTGIEIEYLQLAVSSSPFDFGFAGIILAVIVVFGAVLASAANVGEGDD